VFDACVFMLGGGVVTVDGCDFGTSLPYELGGMLASGSDLQLLVPSQSNSAATAITIPDCVTLAQYELTSTVPTVTMPTRLFRGQKLRVMLLNQSGVNWAANVTWTGAQNYGTTASNALAGEVVFAEFTVSDIDASGTYVWVGSSIKIGSAG
jgi:hypothetical protein